MVIFKLTYEKDDTAFEEYWEDELKCINRGEELEKKKYANINKKQIQMELPIVLGDIKTKKGQFTVHFINTDMAGEIMRVVGDVAPREEVLLDCIGLLRGLERKSSDVRSNTIVYMRSDI